MNETKKSQESEKNLEAELYIRLFIDKFIFNSKDATCTPKDYYRLISDSTQLKEGLGLPARQTIEKHCDVINQYLQYLYKNNSINPLLSWYKPSFENKQQEFFFFQLNNLLRIKAVCNLLTELRKYTAPDFVLVGPNKVAMPPIIDVNVIGDNLYDACFSIHTQESEIYKQTIKSSESCNMKDLTFKIKSRIRFLSSTALIL